MSVDINKTDSEYLLEIRHLRKAFDDLTVLRDISLKVSPKEVLSIIGPSGSGKSTLLRCAVMLERMDGGELIYEGQKAAWEDERGFCYAGKEELKQIKKKIGLVFQNFNLFPHMSVLQNVIDAPVHVQKMNMAEATEYGMSLLTRLGLGDKAAAYPCQLSGGQQQRVSIARALALRPKILFFDEPTSSLDPELTGEVLRVIRGLAKAHMTMVIVTHEMQFAREVSDHIIFMENGLIMAEGSPEEVFSAENSRVMEFAGRL